jgi:single-strand DNA-binding protein
LRGISPQGKPDIYIEGRIQTKCWENLEGNKRYTTEIVAQTMQMLGSLGKGGQAITKEERIPRGEPISIPEDDIPF